jgi:hypothetical protein
MEKEYMQGDVSETSLLNPKKYFLHLTDKKYQDEKFSDVLRPPRSYGKPIQDRGPLYPSFLEAERKLGLNQDINTEATRRLKRKAEDVEMARKVRRMGY